jgi:hypothetical protein
MPGMAELVEYIADPQSGQKPRLIMFPLSAGLSKNRCSPVISKAASGTIMCEPCPAALVLRQSLQ